MSTESENLYTKNDQLIAQIYDNLSGENKSEEAISLLLNPNHISPTEQVKILGLLGEKCKGKRKNRSEQLYGTKR